MILVFSTIPNEKEWHTVIKKLCLLKSIFFIRLVVLSTLTGVNSLSCVSMNNQECKVRRQIVNANGYGAVFFSFSIKTSKGSGSCNCINNPYVKLCVPDVVKKLKC